MKVRFGSVLTGILAVIVSAATSAAQTSHRSPTPAFLTTLKHGQWIQLEGIPQKDLSVICTEVKVLTGDFLDDDWELRGMVHDLDPAAHEFSVGRYRVHLKAGVEYDDDDDDDAGKFKSFSDLHPGRFVKVEGTYLKDGTFLAKEINDESGKVVRKPGIEQSIKIVGKIETVNPTRLTIAAMGSRFLVDDKTKLKSVIK